MSKKNYRKKYDNSVNTDKSTNPKKEEIDRKASEYWDKKYEIKKPELIFGKAHFIILGAALLLIIVGFFLMTGGAMTEETKWEPGTIYSFTRITLAPFLVLLGLGAVGFAIFYNDKGSKEKDQNIEQEL